MLIQISQRSLLDPHVSRISGITQQRKALGDSMSNELFGAASLSSDILLTESEVSTLEIFVTFCLEGNFTVDLTNNF